MEISGADERAAYPALACAGDAKLRRRVDALLRAHAESDDLLDPPDALILSDPTEDEAGFIGDPFSTPLGSV